MAGLTNIGFTPLKLEDITARIESRLETYNPGFDFAPESPDGQLIGIMSVLIAQAWGELDMVYHSYNPSSATGQALRNLGLISGIGKDTASRSNATINMIGVAGTSIPANSTVSDSEGNEFYTVFGGEIPFSTLAISRVAGPLPLPIGTIDTIVDNLDGWSSIDQPVAGLTGKVPVSDLHYRNLRNRTVMRNYSGIVDAMQARLIELGVEQASVLNNSDTTNNLPDGTPPLTVHATVGEVGLVTDLEIATAIMETIGIGIPTYGTSTVAITDSQGVVQNINFSKAVAVDVFIDLNITFLDPDIGGAEKAIKEALVTEINGLLAGEDVIWSQLFGLVTQFASAQINGPTGLQVGSSLGSLNNDNLVILAGEYANTSIGSIQITVV
jgi:uncharacterized phage protein gp47/JayE